MSKTLSRKELQNIREAARMAAANVPSHLWIRAYEALVDAADHLDAMEARTEAK